MNQLDFMRRTAVVTGGAAGIGFAIAQRLVASGARVSLWDRDAAALSDDAAINNVVAYIKTLPDTPAPATVKGNAKDGEDNYVTCGACHGTKGQGIQSTNAPRLKGMSDWYMITQLKNFKQGIRGTHPKDLYGTQMNFMAAILTSDRETDDLVAYIDTLR